MNSLAPQTKALDTTPVDIAVAAQDARKPVSPTLVGLFFEDINFACDGGLNANLVNNHSFEGVYLDRRLHSEFVAVVTRRRPRRKFDRARHWSISGGRLEVLDDEPVAAGGHFARLHSGGTAVLSNPGYPGDGGTPSMPARSGVPLDFRAHVRPVSWRGELEIRIVGLDGRTNASARLDVGTGDEWQRVSVRLHPERTELAALQLVVHGTGIVDVDEISLVPADHWGAGDPRWSQGLLRRDLVETLRDLAPTFMRFPGGCIVEGLEGSNAYDWKASVGPIEQRRPDYNLWALSRAHGDYSQSRQIGFYEYFLLCEDLGMEPVPVVSAGLCCQYRSREVLATDDVRFDQLITDTLDLIDWATGDPGESSWAALRAEAGHPEPFRLNYLAIGNENHGHDYLDRFERIRTAVEAHHPGLTIIMSSGPFPRGKGFDLSWSHARAGRSDLLVDEHFYNRPSWFRKAARRYDDYPRGGARVFVGEYAAHFPTLMLPAPARKPANTFESALAEAAFLTGLERNADVVAMSSYAPLLNRVGSGQWQHNMVDFTAFTVQPTANYVVHQLFATTLGTRIVPLSGALPEDIFASASTTDQALFIHLVNTSGQTAALRLVVDGPTSDTARVQRIQADPGARNALDSDGTAHTQVSVEETSEFVHDGTVALSLPAYSATAVSLTLQREALPESVGS
ncbi:hypothetical protein C5E45_31025 [Nocardia nova]|uniref:non-reducing end alpha-L-arabinofuranosidase n=1 Tax=Nocardia nova TaxID=37330 RepID=A0A2S6AGR1_9NOCA|nr:alpha-L-arabinofuranosidase C-terminal domain-containing protein [Nocardia nova]PPJ21626.1 hypothetical protein C5E41_29365 [Nocardia nova]PPJ33956.1 hypothetical protein C5E45_31025 [Nocardia nova]